MSEQEAAVREAREKQREWEQKKQERSAGLREAFNSEGELSRSWMREILDTDDLSELLNEYEIRKIRGLLNKQQLLANLSEPQVHDRWHWLQVQQLKILGSFPPEESAMQGPVRAFFMKDEAEQLTALSAEQRNAIDQIIKSLQNMQTRSEDGFERKQSNTTIARTETGSDESEDDSGGFSLFS